MAQIGIVNETMNKSHYVSLLIAKQLAEAGIDFPESEKVWVKPFGTRKKWELEERNYWDDDEIVITLLIPAPSLSELLDRLPDKCGIERGKYVLHENEWSCDPPPNTTNDITFNYSTFAKTAPDVAAKMLIKLEGEG